MTSNLYTPQQELPNSQPASTFLNGTFSSLNQTHTSNTTEIAAMAIWHMIQGFLGSFPQYDPGNSTGSVVGVNLFAESYGGKFGPAFASLWDEQNKKRLNGTMPKGGSLAVKLVSLGIINGCVDDLIQAPFYPQMAVNNTFGVTAINPTRAELAAASFSAPGGCSDSIAKCREALASQDANDSGDISVVDSLCSSAYSYCVNNVMNPYQDAGRSFYDIAHFIPDSFPPSTYIEYLNTAAFQSAIGTPVNYTQTDNEVIAAFSATGDYERDALVPDIAALLNSGVRVGLIYGDRDYICNWMGGEAISFAVAAATSPDYLSKFNAAGYAPIIVNESYIGGVVRQYGNLSFSRIYDAGHMVPAYQPETAFQVFARIISGTSVSTGKTIDITQYNTTGDANATHTTSLPSSPSATCWIRNVPGSCNDEQKNMLLKNEGTVINGVLYSSAEEWSSSAGIAASSTSSASPTGTYTTITQVLTGAFTASSTPTPNAGAVLHPVSDQAIILGIGGVAAAAVLYGG
jgi:carboxypeptidase C (cathepsin A)